MLIKHRRNLFILFMVIISINFYICILCYQPIYAIVNTPYEMNPSEGIYGFDTYNGNGGYGDYISGNLNMYGPFAPPAVDYIKHANAAVYERVSVSKPVQAPQLKTDILKQDGKSTNNSSTSAIIPAIYGKEYNEAKSKNDYIGMAQAAQAADNWRQANGQQKKNTEYIEDLWTLAAKKNTHIVTTVVQPSTPVQQNRSSLATDDPTKVPGNEFKWVNGMKVYRYRGLDANGEKITNKAFPDDVASPNAHYENRNYLDVENALDSGLLKLRYPPDVKKINAMAAAQKFLNDHPEWKSYSPPWTVEKILDKFIPIQDANGRIQFESVHEGSSGKLYYITHETGYTPPPPEPRTITRTVYDPLPDPPPTAFITFSRSRIRTGEVVTLIASASDNKHIISAIYGGNGYTGGLKEIKGVQSGCSSIQVSYATVGRKKVSMTVSDGANKAVTVWTEVEVTAVAEKVMNDTGHDPVAVINALSFIKVNAPLNVSGESSYDPDGDPITQYIWSSPGAKGVLNNSTGVLTYPEEGSYYIELTVKSVNRSGKIETSRKVTRTVTVIKDKELKDGDKQVVKPEPPVAIIEAAGWVKPGETVVVSGEKSYDPDGGIIVSYRWTCEGAQGALTGRAGTVSYGSEGVYYITLVVKDDQKLESKPFTKKITVIGNTDAPPADENIDEGVAKSVQDAIDHLLTGDGVSIPDDMLQQVIDALNPPMKDYYFETELNASALIRVALTGETALISEDNMQDRIPEMKSGYGIYVEIDSGVTLHRSDPDVDPDGIETIANAQKAWVEINGEKHYLEISDTSSDIDRWKRKFITPANPESPYRNRVIYIPVDLADGIYDIKIGIEGASSPGGTMNRYLDAKLEIKGDMYEDDATGGIRK